MTTVNAANMINITSGTNVPNVLVSTLTGSTPPWRLYYDASATAYSKIVIELRNVMFDAGTGSQDLRCRLLDSSGAQYTGAQYYSDFRTFSSTGAADVTVTNGTYFNLTPGNALDWDAATPYEGNLEIINPGTGSTPPDSLASWQGSIWLEARWRGAGSRFQARGCYGAGYTDAGSIYGIELYWSGGSNFETTSTAIVYAFKTT